MTNVVKQSMTPVLISSSFVCKKLKSLLYLSCFSQVHVCVHIFSPDWRHSLIKWGIQAPEIKHKKQPVNCSLPTLIGVQLSYWHPVYEVYIRLNPIESLQQCFSELVNMSPVWIGVTSLRKALVNAFICRHSWWVLCSSWNVDSGWSWFFTCDMDNSILYNT